LGRGGQEWADTDGNCCSQRTGHPSPQGICCGWSGAPQSSFRGKGVGGLTAEQREQAGGGGIRVDGCVALWGRGVRRGKGRPAGTAAAGGYATAWARMAADAGNGGTRARRRRGGGGKRGGEARKAAAGGGEAWQGRLWKGDRGSAVGRALMCRATGSEPTKGPQHGWAAFFERWERACVGCLGAWVRGTVHG